MYNVYLTKLANYFVKIFELEEDFFDDTDFTNELIAFSTLAITCILLWTMVFR